MTDWFRALSAIVNRHEPAAEPRALPRAAAALLLEMAATEEGFDAVELDAVHAAMRQTFDIDERELDALLEEAHTARRQSVSLYDFTESLRRGLSPGQRGDLVEWLWRVAFADQRIGDHEAHLVRKAADLLGVSQDEYIRRKLRVLE
ncbi:TerB family tellurite resistance protein [Pseudomarimonas salicorniae]|uniref:TerB family tellurite resistance protein n=1 Tax=Pseudomarimonas salicorniae TaxID=2933270 RepID=A0ABT0GEQ5_9GAMM|nr:TerB family tellurite resistance protein [Lysobacter sp. CAU 1642]MCK7593031.1 TerB family tellurite resistance protein [Lysobacter sp. CAU 1642]